jgi:hypothetical protein
MGWIPPTISSKMMVSSSPHSPVFERASVIDGVAEGFSGFRCRFFGGVGALGGSD